MNDPIVVTTLQRIQTDPQGKLLSQLPFLSRRPSFDGQTYVAPWTQVTWPLRSDKTITIGELTLTYAEVSAFVVAIAEQEKASTV